MHRQHHGVQSKRYHLAQQVPYVREMSAQLVKTRRGKRAAVACLGHFLMFGVFFFNFNLFTTFLWFFFSFFLWFYFSLCCSFTLSLEQSLGHVESGQRRGRRHRATCSPTRVGGEYDGGGTGPSRTPVPGPITYVKSVFMIHVGGTRCVLSSTDHILKIRARITLTVECIRTCIFLFLFYV